MSIIHDPIAHTYTTESGVALPSITQILDAVGFNAGMAGIPPDILRHAADRGSLVHLLCHAHDTGQVIDHATLPQDLLTEAQPYVEAYRAWRDGTKWKLIEAENPRGSEERGYAGTPDRVFMAPDGWRWVVDIKTSSKISGTAHIQTAAQDLLLDEIDQSKRMVLQLCKDGTFNEIICDDLDDYNVWDRALSVYEYLAKHKLLARKR